MKKVRISKQTPLKDGDTFNIDNCIGWSITNEGATDATFGYQGQPETFTLQTTETREFAFLPHDRVYAGEMEVKFTGGAGSLTVILFKIRSEED